MQDIFINRIVFRSMGGLLAADTLLAIANSRPDKEAPLWPRIIACIAFDTPVRMTLFLSLYCTSQMSHTQTTVLRTAPICIQEQRHQSS